MYALNKTCEHDAWRKTLDERKAKSGHTNSKSSTTPSTTQNLNPVNKLALSESLRTALCTQAGLSSDASDLIGLTHSGTRETSRSEPWVEFHINYSLWFIISGTPGSHDLRN